MNSSNSLDTILKINNLTKIYRTLKTEFVALDNVSLEFKRNQSVGILGHNGSGKTTMVEIVASVKKATHGTIEFNFLNKKNPKENIGIQFQETSFPTGFKVIDIINFYLEIFSQTLNKEEILESLKLFQLYDKLNSLVSKLSGGQQQRLNIILSILHSPELIILDEISTGLDILAKTKIKNFINKLVAKKQATLILISHNLDEIEELCERIIILNNGSVYFDGLIADVNKEYGSLAKLIDAYFEKEKLL